MVSVIGSCKHRECVSKILKPILQTIPSLPAVRMLNECYTAISLDALGPLQMKIENECHFNSLCNKCEKEKEKDDKMDKASDRRCKTKKVWIVLFACLTTRHITLELLQNKSCESF